MTELQYLETHVVDQCNLNCRGCSHFSPIAKKNNYSFDEFENDIIRLSELIDGVKTFRLLGGEPFIALNLPKYIIAVRQTFPKTDLRIVTNGLLIGKAEKFLLEIIREYSVQLDISLYPPTMEIIDEIIEILIMNNLRYSLYGPIEKFKKRITLSGKYNNVESFEKCISNNCTFLYRGKISACPGPSLCYILNDRFGSELNGKNDVIDIYIPEVTGKQILEFINRPLELCKHCGLVFEFNWGKHNVMNLSDWTIDE